MTFKNAVQKNKDGGFIFGPIILKYSILSLLIMTKMLIYFVLPLVVSFSRNRQLKKSNFEKNVTFPDEKIFRTDGLFFFKILTYIHMTHVNFLLHRLLFSETHTDRQTRQICNRHTDRHTDGHVFFSSLTIISKTHVNILIHRHIVSETQTDR